VESVDYPHVMVGRADFVVDSTIPSSGTAVFGSLFFNLLPGDNYPLSAHEVQVVLGSGCQADQPILSVQVLLNGILFDDWSIICASKEGNLLKNEAPSQIARLLLTVPGWNKESPSELLQQFVVNVYPL
jgi:hypothetical protein